jgi:hypothetical protein
MKKMFLLEGGEMKTSFNDFNVNTGRIQAGGTYVSIQTITVDGITRTKRTETTNGVTTTTIIEGPSNNHIGVHQVIGSDGSQSIIWGNNNRVGSYQCISGLHTGGGAVNIVASQVIRK